MILIIGAGPAGLSTAYHLESADYLVLERAGEPGGLCRSFDLGGATFDLGGHAFFTKHDYVRELVERLCPTGIDRQPRSAWVSSHGTFLPYPFQSNLFGLPVDVVEECLTGLVEAARESDGGPPNSVREWIDRAFGPGIAKHFMTPYNEKVWAFPLDEVAPDWVVNRIVSPDTGAIIAGALRRRPFTDFPNATVAYPAAGGFANLYQGFLPAVGDRLRQETVERIDPRARQVTLASGERLGYDLVCSTMPLDELVRRTEDVTDCCVRAAALLRHNSLYAVNLVVDRPGLTDMQRIYSADPAVPFHKLVLNSNSSASLRARPVFGIQAEVSYSPHKPVDRANLETRVRRSLIDIGLLDGTEEIVASSVVELPHAYPVYTVDTKAAREHLLDCFEKRGILCAGRFGEWLYINSDDAVMRGKARAEQLDTLLR